MTTPAAPRRRSRKVSGPRITVPRPAAVETTPGPRPEGNQIYRLENAS